MNKVVNLYPVGSVEYRLAQYAKDLNQLFFHEENRKMMEVHDQYVKMTQQITIF